MHRQYMITQMSRTDTSTIFPDPDNLLVGNSESSSGLTDDQRRTMYSHWIEAGANLILGSDMTDLDNLGKSMLQDEQLNWIADQFTSKHPIRQGKAMTTPTKANRSNFGPLVLMPMARACLPG